MVKLSALSLRGQVRIRSFESHVAYIFFQFDAIISVKLYQVIVSLKKLIPILNYVETRSKIDYLPIIA